MNVPLLHHSSKVDFDNFSWEHVGEGTGNNFFGVGIYFSNQEEQANIYGNIASPFCFYSNGEKVLELPPVCNKYVDDFFNNNHFYDGNIKNPDGVVLAGEESGTFNGISSKIDFNLGSGFLPELYDYCVSQLNLNIEKSSSRLIKYAKKFGSLESIPPYISDDIKLSIQKRKSALNFLENYKDIRKKVKNTDNITYQKERHHYLVRIGEENSNGEIIPTQEEELFLWDKEVSREFLLKVEKSLPAGLSLGSILNENPNGETFYKRLTSLFENGKKASEFLYEKCGIKGLKYKPDDGKTNEDLYNYVFFSDKLIHIVEKNSYRKAVKEELEADRSLSKDECRDVIMNIQQRSGNNIKVNFVDNASELPVAIKSQPGFDKKIAGLANGDEVYFVLDNIKSREEAVNVWLHEVGQHQGVKNIIPNKEVREHIFENVWKSAKILAEDSNNTEIRKAVNQVRFSYKESDFSKAELGSEFLAHFSESALVKGKLNQTEKHFFSNIVSLIRNVVDRCFKIDSKKCLSAEELTKLTVTSIKSNFKNQKVLKEIKFKPEQLSVPKNKHQRIAV